MDSVRNAKKDELAGILRAFWGRNSEERKREAERAPKESILKMKSERSEQEGGRKEMSSLPENFGHVPGNFGPVSDYVLL